MTDHIITLTNKYKNILFDSSDQYSLYIKININYTRRLDNRIIFVMPIDIKTAFSFQKDNYCWSLFKARSQCVSYSLSFHFLNNIII